MKLPWRNVKDLKSYLIYLQNDVDILRRTLNKGRGIPDFKEESFVKIVVHINRIDEVISDLIGDNPYLTEKQKTVMEDME